MCKVNIKYFDHNPKQVWRVTSVPESRSPWTHLRKLPGCVFVSVEYSFKTPISIEDLKKIICSQDAHYDFTIKIKDQRIELYSTETYLSMTMLLLDDYVVVSIRPAGHKKLPDSCMQILKALKDAL